MNLFELNWKALEGHRRRAATYVVLSALSAMFEALGLVALVPLISSVVENEATAELDFLSPYLSGTTLQVVALGSFMGLGVMAAGTRAFAEIYSYRLRTRLEEGLRRDLSALLLRVEWSRYVQLEQGDVASNTLVRAAQVAIGALQFLNSLGAAAVVFVLTATAVALNWRLSLFAVIFGGLAAIGYRFSRKIAERHTSQLSDVVSQIGRDVTQIFGNLKFFRSTGNVARSEERMFGVYDLFADHTYRVQTINPKMRFIFESAAAIFLGLILVLIYFLEGGTVTAMSIAFVAVFTRLAPRVQVFQELLQNARIARPWYAKWDEMVDAIAEVQDQRTSGGATPTFDSDITFKDVAFTFPGTDATVLHGLSWILPQSGCIAFVGESGSGKSTTLDLVTGLMRPSGGQVLVDGAPLEDIDIEMWQSRIGLVLQETPMFHGTIYENIRWTEEEDDREWASECPTLANAANFVSEMPQGLDTEIGERGGRLSGGQRQRIAIARALYRRPWLLLLDEATSALDSESEETVRVALESIKGTCAIAIVAHRLSTVTMADEIFVLGDGELLESGSWDELTARQGGALSKMAARQQMDVASTSANAG